MAEKQAAVDSQKNGNNTYSKVTNKQFSGAIPELGNLVYKSNTKDSGNIFLKTTLAISGYVGSKYGRDMMLLVKYIEESRSFTKPKLRVDARGGEPSASALAEYKIDMDIYNKENKEYLLNKGMVFGIILGQCTEAVTTRLESMNEFKEWEKKSDVVSFLKQLREFAYTAGGIHHPSWVAQDNLRKLVTINQGSRESVEKYYIRFKNATEVLQTQWGILHPDNLTEGDGIKSNESKIKAREDVYIMMFLEGSDKHRFGKLLSDIRNSYVSGNKDAYPTSLTATVTLLGSVDAASNKTNPGKVIPEMTTSSFVQTNSKMKCFKCGKKGHSKQNCPSRDHQQAFMMDDEDSDAATSVRSGRSASPHPSASTWAKASKRS
jgi:Zinc knuckle